MARILVVDDEPGIVRFVKRALESAGHTAHTATDGLSGLGLHGELKPDLMLLDLVMPGFSGMSVLAAVLADNPHGRVIVLSAVADVQARVRALDAGAADFVPKPFAISELLARVRVQLRGPGEVPMPRLAADEINVGSMRLELRSRRLKGGERQVELSAREFALLEFLMRRSGNVCTRSELLSEVWGYGFDPGSNVVDVTVARLRSKIEGMRIETVRNVGYTLSPA